MAATHFERPGAASKRRRRLARPAGGVKSSRGAYKMALFERNPRGVRIAAWALALGAVGGWKYWERRKEREFSAGDAQRWNQDVLSKAAADKARKAAAKARRRAADQGDEA